MKTKSIQLGMGLAMMAVGIAGTNSWAADRVFRAVAIEVSGTKFWVPSYFKVKKGDHVKFQLVSKVSGAGNVHGFAIKSFGVEAVVDEKGKDVEFVADKAGLFDIYCHLHPGHIGGQFEVGE